MTDTHKTRRETIIAPYGREIRLADVDFESGMRLLRVTIREGRRFTILEIDTRSARAWGEEMIAWADDAGAAGQSDGRDHAPT